MWTCPKCGSIVDSTFEVCWACGTTAEGVEDPSFVTADEAGPIEDLTPDKQENSPDSELPEPPLTLVESYRAYDAVEAQFLVDQLAEQGIPAVVQGTRMSLTENPLSLFAPRVMVREQDLSRARLFFDEFERRKRDRAHSVAD